MSEFRKLAEECLHQAQVASLRPRPLEDGPGWCVELTRHDGRVERIGTFGAKATAQDWIDWQSPKFLRGKVHPERHGRERERHEQQECPQ
jgi:hypothetical protein